MEALSATVKQNTGNAKLTSRLAQGALNTVGRGSDAVTRVTETLDGITTSSRKVGETVCIIERIAFQTNILAFNAAVEVACAGEQVRGFAGVASEVRVLARRSVAAMCAKRCVSSMPWKMRQVDAGWNSELGGSGVLWRRGHFRSQHDAQDLSPRRQ